MPVSLDSLYFFWQTVTTTEDERQILAVGVPRDLIDDNVRALKQVGISPHIIELRPMSLIRVVNREQALILNVEPTSFDVIMVIKGVPEVIHSMGWRLDDLNMEDAADYLATNLEMTVDFYNAHHIESPFDADNPVFITGQMSTNPALMDRLQARLVFGVEQLIPPLECPAFLPVSQYAANIGLAMRKEMALESNDERAGVMSLDMNLLPRIYRPWRPSARQMYAVVIIVAAIALIFPLMQITGEAVAKTTQLQARFDSLNNQLLVKKVQIQSREPLQKAINEYNSLVTREVSFSEDIKAIIDIAKRIGVAVDSLRHNGSEISINCQAKDGDYRTFRAYKEALEESGRFTIPVTPPEGYPYITGGEIRLKHKPLEETPP